MMNTSVRLEAAAPEALVAVGSATQRASAAAIVYEELPQVSAKGKAEPSTLTELHPIARVGTEERESTPFVGRHAELSMLTQLFERSRSRPSTEFVTIIGEPRLGNIAEIDPLLMSVSSSDGDSA